MNTFKLILVAGIMLSFPIIAQAIDTVPLPEKPKSIAKSFSANFQYSNRTTRKSSFGKLRVSNNKARLDLAPDRTGKKVSIIARRDINQIWIIDHAKKRYTRLPVNNKVIKNLAKKNRINRKTSKLSSKKTGKQKITRKRIDVSMVKKRKTIKSSSEIWVSERFNVPILIRDNTGTSTQLKNLRKTSLSPALFNLPRNYQKSSKVLSTTKRPALPISPRVQSRDTQDSDSTRPWEDSIDRPGEPRVHSFTPSEASSSDAKKSACEYDCKNEFGEDLAVSSMGGWNPVGWIVSGVLYDRCMGDCDRITSSARCGGGGGGSSGSPLRRK